MSALVGLTAIQDCEDSVAAVDAEDKVVVYRNWLGLMKGDLAETFRKGRTDPRQSGSAVHGPGWQRFLTRHSLLFVRNVGHLMTNDAVLTADGREVPEGILDTLITATCALHDLREEPPAQLRKDVYIVKPKCTDPTRSVSRLRCSAVSRRFLG